MKRFLPVSCMEGLCGSGCELSTFMKGISNETAWEHAEQIIDKNSNLEILGLYGALGVGKSHLLHAIECMFEQQHPDAEIIVTSAIYLQDKDELWDVYEPEFESDIIENSYLEGRIDLLLIEDIQDFHSEEEWVNLEILCRYAEEQGAKVVFTANCTNPSELKFPRGWLTAFFKRSVWVEMKTPEPSIRLKIIENMLTCSELTDLHLSNAAIHYIANEEKGDIKKILFLLKVMSDAENKKMVDVEDIKRWSQDSFK